MATYTKEDLKNKDWNNMKCDFCNNEATVSLGTEHKFTMCRDCLKEAISYLKEKKNECEDCEELEIEDDDMF